MFFCLKIQFKMRALIIIILFFYLKTQEMFLGSTETTKMVFWLHKSTRQIIILILSPSFDSETCSHFLLFRLSNSLLHYIISQIC